MFFIYNIVLFLVTLLVGGIPLLNQSWNEKRIKYLLSFSGAFLLGITLTHLIPESVAHKGTAAGLLVLLGFFLQQLVQPLTHGVEHGHAHVGEHNRYFKVWPLLAGLSVHALSEGLPLGAHYNDAATLPLLYAAIALHKMPEAMLMASLVAAHDRKRAIAVLVIFAAITPCTGLLTGLLGNYFPAFAVWVAWCVPVIAGAFIHIATTIFYESGTKSHDMTLTKWLVIFAGVALAAVTALFAH
ncbi:MAG: ZIP family metal transporter [Edaphocola sp.]